MSSKYSIPKTYTKLRDWRESNPRLSDHALERWDARVPPGAISPESAYGRATTLTDLSMSAFTTNQGRDFESAHYYRGKTATGETYAVVFLVRNDTVVTVFSLEQVNSAPVRAYLKELGHSVIVHE